MKLKVEDELIIAIEVVLMIRNKRNREVDVLVVP